MPWPGRTYRSSIVKFGGISSSSPVSRLLGDDRWMGHLEVAFSGERLMFTGNHFGKKENRPWDIFELDLKTGKTESLTAHMPEDTDSYNSYWPNNLFHVRPPLPGRPGMFAGIVSGHHGVRRLGELVV